MGEALRSTRVPGRDAGQVERGLPGLAVVLYIHVTEESGTALECGVGLESFEELADSGGMAPESLWELWRWGRGAWWTVRVPERSLHAALAQTVGATLDEFCAFVDTHGGQ